MFLKQALKNYASLQVLARDICNYAALKLIIVTFSMMFYIVALGDGNDL